MAILREPAVSGLFYSANKDILYKEIERFLEEATLYPYVPQAIVSPHAGYVYSGKTAAVSYKQLLNLDKDKHYTFLLIGPSHYVYMNGISFGYYDYWITPLGKVRVNTDRIDRFIKDNRNFPITLNHLPHQREHSLEVQVPFLQVVMREFDIIPVVYGDVEASILKRVIEYFKDDGTVVIISSDLSHYYPDAVARQMDKNCHTAVEKVDERYLMECEACGKTGIEAMIMYAKENGLKGKLLEYRTSGDVSGDYDAVVGYGSYIFYK